MLKLLGFRGSPPEDLQNNNGTSSTNIAADESSLTSPSDPNVSPSSLINHNGFETINLNEDDTISLKQHTDITIDINSKI